MKLFSVLMWFGALTSVMALEFRPESIPLVIHDPRIAIPQQKIDNIDATVGLAPKTGKFFVSLTNRYLNETLDVDWSPNLVVEFFETPIFRNINELRLEAGHGTIPRWLIQNHRPTHFIRSQFLIAYLHRLNAHRPELRKGQYLVEHPHKRLTHSVLRLNYPQALEILPILETAGHISAEDVIWIEEESAPYEATLDQGHCSAVPVQGSNRLFFLTDHHCMGSQSICNATSIHTFKQLTLDTQDPKDVHTDARFGTWDCDQVIFADRDLDTTLFTVKGTPADLPPVAFSLQDPDIDAGLYALGHPGLPKMPPTRQRLKRISHGARTPFPLAGKSLGWDIRSLFGGTKIALKVQNLEGQLAGTHRVWPGMSGGPTFDSSTHRLVGLTHAIHTITEKNTLEDCPILYFAQVPCPKTKTRELSLVTPIATIYERHRSVFEKLGIVPIPLDSE